MVCKDCGTEKRKDAFYKHPAMAGGRLNSCKECRKAYQRARHHLNMQNPAWVAKERQRSRAKALTPIGRARTVRYREENSERYKANNALNNAVRDGKIIKFKNCERCDQPGRVEGHHEDYTKPLEVQWLCPKCHHTTEAKNV